MPQLKPIILAVFAAGFALPLVGCEERVVGVRNDWTSAGRPFGSARDDDDPYNRVDEVDLRDRYGTSRPAEE